MRKLFHKIFDKFPILRYIVTSLVKWFFIIAVTMAALFGILSVTGIYTKLESALDLKYNSPFVVTPMIVFSALALLCFFIGFLLYFHKYKRSKSKSTFYDAFSNILNKTDLTQKG